MQKQYEEIKDRMNKTLQSLKKEFQSLRTGRASLSLLDDIKVNAYDSMMPLNQVGTLNIPEPRMITIQPWDKSIMGTIEKAILASNIGLNPSNDGNLIRIPIPALTEERRKELVKYIKKQAEESKVAVRNIRRDGNNNLKKMKNNDEITEDDEKQGLKEIQKITDEYIEKIDELVKEKEKEIMEV